jgi:tRNA A37 threonylcarbamoyladenosine synthetase subunit TsaC/SUA5/YrdC
VANDFEMTMNELLILDGGPCQVGLESTVLDLTQRVRQTLPFTWSCLVSA